LELLTGDRDKIYDLANKGFNLMPEKIVRSTEALSILGCLIDKTEIFVAER
jgi:hypothetical protein